MKVYIISFSRASNGAISLLKKKMAEKNMLTESCEEANYFLAVGDRLETFDFALARLREGRRIIHLWAGEISQGTYDEVYRHSLTLMSCLQLCTNPTAKKRVKTLCKSVDKTPNVVVVGNIMMENLETDDSIVPNEEYDLVLYNPCLENMEEDLKQIFDILQTSERPFFWIRPNIDKGAEIIMKYANSTSQSRPKFLALLKNCKRFISNSSCMYYEAPFFLKPEQIIPIGKRNSDRESKRANMKIKNASNNVIKAIQELEKADDRKRETYQV